MKKDQGADRGCEERIVARRPNLDSLRGKLKRPESLHERNGACEIISKLDTVNRSQKDRWTRIGQSEKLNGQLTPRACAASRPRRF